MSFAQQSFQLNDLLGERRVNFYLKEIDMIKIEKVISNFVLLVFFVVLVYIGCALTRFMSEHPMSNEFVIFSYFSEVINFEDVERFK